MIQISLTTALVLYTTFLGGAALFVWIYTELSVRRSYAILEKQFLWHCVFCGYVYLDEAAQTISRCPRCASYSSVDDKNARYVRTSHYEDEPEETAEPRRDSSHRKRPHQRRRGPRRR